MRRKKSIEVVFRAILPNLCVTLLAGCSTLFGSPPQSTELPVFEASATPSITMNPPTFTPQATIEPATPITTASRTSSAPSAADLPLTETPPPTDPGPGWIELTPESSGASPTRKYVCPWLDEPGEVPQTAFRVVQAFPHDPAAYTEGLVLEDGILYESTGLRGASSLRRVELETGKVLQKEDIPEPYFGEGIAVHDGKIFQLTWQEGTGFVFDQETFELLETFAYQTEGWGLTQDGTQLIRSDGTNRLAFIDPAILEVERILPVTAGGLPVQKLNELEYVQGEIWANVYLTSCVARIDPRDGRVVGWIDLSGLLSVDEMRTAEVPNGIAYDPVSERLLVSGKFWPWIFEIEQLPEQKDS